MKQIIEQAKKIYSLEDCTFTPVSGHERGRNQIVIVSRGGGKIYVLRISALGDRSENDYLAETEFVRFLAENGGPVADVIPSVRGRLVECVEADGKEVFVSLFVYANGMLLADNGYRYREGAPLSEYFYNTGKALGTIHRLSKTYKPVHSRPDYFDKYNMAYLDGLIPDEYSELKSAIAKRLDTFSALPKNKSCYGLVHFDYSDGNYHIDMATGAIIVFDFDNCMNCWYMFDLANLWIHNEGWTRQEPDPGKRFEIMQQCFDLQLQGYKSETDLPEEMLEKLPLFIDMVLIENIIDEFECAAREGEELDFEDIEDAAECLIYDIPYAGIEGTVVTVISKTKYEASESEIKKLFSFHKLGNVVDIVALGCGEFNAAYKVTCYNGFSYALKIAPPEGSKILSYEKNMMKSEVFWYSQMHEKTDILCPKVYVSDFSKEIIKSNCFIMELMPGGLIWEMGITAEEYESIQKQKICMLTKIHRITNDGYGYIQTGLKATWYEALKNMASWLVDDCKSLGHDTPDGERFIQLIDKHKKLLETVPCRMVNFDLWDSNILYNKETGKICWIDPERGFWGDPVADFITLGSGQKAPLSAKQKELDIYNEMATEKILLTKETEIRYALAVCYLALIEEVEKYVRYEPDNSTYIRNTVDAREMYDMAFGLL